ncbi:MAG: glycoside hydrolase family 2 protein [Armatimonadota bacterium]
MTRRLTPPNRDLTRAVFAILLSVGVTRAMPQDLSGPVEKGPMGLTWQATDADAPMRDWVDLGGRWQFCTDPEDALTLERLDVVGWWRNIQVPSVWEAQFPDLVGYDGAAWYRRKVKLREEWRAGRVFLRFQAVDYFAEVWVNGQKVGEHEGGYTPFEFDVSASVHPAGENEIVVRVVDPTNDRNRFPDFPVSEIPHGKQTHYCNTGGIWQKVWMERRQPAYITRLHITPELDSGEAVVRLDLAGEAENTTAVVHVVDAEGEVAAQDRASVAEGAQSIELRPHMRRFTPWHPDQPYLYQAHVWLLREGKAVDFLGDSFGMRKIEARDNLIYLNDEPIFLAGALDQAFYPDTIYAEPSDEELEKQFLMAKHLGLNFFRTHIKIPDPRYLEVADRVGMLLWVDLPNWGNLTNEAKARVRQTLVDWVNRDYNHPSLFVWDLMNEEWGADFGDPDHRKWLRSMWDLVKGMDPSRLVVDNSPAGGGHVISDIEDQHVYMSMPERRQDFARWCEEFAGHPDYTFKWPDSERRGFEPLVVSEYGNWGLPDVGKLRQHYGGEDPYWFDQGNYGGPILAGERRFYEWGLDKVWGSFAEMARDSQWHQFDSLKMQIEEMRRHPQIVGYVITQLTDLNSESNGLMTMTRGGKSYHDTLGRVQTQDLVFADCERQAYFPGEEIRLPVRVSHFSSRRVDMWRIKWRLAGHEASGEIAPVTVAPISAPVVGEVRLRAPEVKKTERAVLWLSLLDEEGDVQSANFVRLTFVPARARESSVRVEAQPGSEAMAALAAKVPQPAGERAVLLADHLDRDLVEELDSGARVLLLAPDGLHGAAFSPLATKDRGSAGVAGNWLGATTWLRHQPFPNMPKRVHLGMEFDACLPRHVLAGFGPEDRDDVLSGVFAGWLHGISPFMVQARCGKGRLLVTTFDVVSQYGEDPISTALLHDLLAYLASEKCQPKRTLDLSQAFGHETVLPTGREGGAQWRYTTERPGQGWQQAHFDDSGWQRGKSGFGRPGTPNIALGTRWETDDIWIRTEFGLGEAPQAAFLRYYHDEDAEVYLNGVQVLRRTGFVTDYQAAELKGEALAALKPGRNVVAAHCRQTGGGQFIDVGVYVR